jgi:hypothetical protein
MTKKRIKEKTEYFCQHCKKFVGFDETIGETGSMPGNFLTVGTLTRQAGLPQRYHNECGQPVLELKKKVRKNV